METSIGVLVGSLITLLVARHFAKEAADELRKESKQLRHLSTLILRALEDSRLAKLTRNDAGEITALAFELNAEPGEYRITGADAELTVKRPDNGGRGS